MPHSGNDCLKLYAADFFLFKIFVICNKTTHTVCQLAYVLKNSQQTSREAQRNDADQSDLATKQNFRVNVT